MINQQPLASNNQAISYSQQAAANKIDAKRIEDRNKLNHLLKKTDRVLFQARAVFPFDFFPDSIIIDENKIAIVSGLFFFSNEIFSIPFTKINGAHATNDLFFGTLIVEVDGLNKNPPPVRYLWSQDALRARRIITGLAACHREGIDLAIFNANELAQKVEQIGQARVN